jgi:hypothetical protein
MGLSIRLGSACFYVSGAVVKRLSDFRAYSLICRPNDIDIYRSGQAILGLTRLKSRLDDWPAERRDATYYSLRYFCGRYLRTCQANPGLTINVYEWAEK